MAVLMACACATGRAPAPGAASPEVAAPEGPPEVATAPALAEAETAGVAAPPPAGPQEAGPGADFASAVRPILKARCSPCHFEGGKVYDKLPFDSPETIRTLGERLFTRIKAPEDQAAIRAFLASPGAPRAP
jgi:hypothetical protein